MDEQTMKQLFAELIEAQGVALGLVVAAMSRQMDVERLAADLRAQIAAGTATRLVPPLAARLATAALAAVDAESSQRRKGTH